MILARGRELVDERIRRRRAAQNVDVHMDAAIRWLFAAQDATEDGGVSHSYLIGRRWMRSYPETTGYIIPTLLSWAESRGSDEARARALRMADWELTVQLPTGAIPEPIDGRPVVFDTGQVIFGWLAAHEVTGDERYLEAAKRGADWLLSELDEEGVWPCPTGTVGPRRVYNARVAWALLELARISPDGRLDSAAGRFLAWTLRQEKRDGWFDRNCLTDDTRPLLHTIAYTARGQLESGRLLNDPTLVEAATRTASRVLAHVAEDGFVPARFDEAWSPAASYACLTGMAQMSIVWRRLVELDAPATLPSDRREAFVAGAERVTGFLMRTQDRSSPNPGLRGGIRGSFPVNGAYGRWRVLNWATKFFVDALMLGHDDTPPRFYS